MIRLLLILCICIRLLLLNQVCAGKSTLQAPLFKNLGNFHYPISTKSPLTQKFFDQGLVLFYGFEWGESIRSFREAVRLDPQCGMCYWGLALALKAKINAPMIGNEYQEGKNAIEKAIALRSQETDIEQNYINALALRFKQQPTTASNKDAFSCHSTANQQEAAATKEMADYLSAMKKIITKYPLDNEAKTLYAVGLFWSLPNRPALTDPKVAEGIELLKKVLAQDKLHVGANHYFIHFVEPYPHPEQAMENADRLKTLVPGSEHLVHMPAHIYFLTGRYHDATEANIQAIETFKNYNESCRAQGFEPEINYLYYHNYDFLRTTATMQGRKQLALTAAQQILSPPFSAMLAKEPTLEWFLPIPYFVKARFGMWDAILQEPKPQMQYYYATSMLHYARGLAFVHQGNIKSAQNELMQLNEIINSPHPKNKFSEDTLKLSSIAQEILKATLADAEHDEEETFSHLTTAMKIQDQMRYHEPPDWYFPVRQAVADAYLKWNHPKEAVFVYQQVLKQYPANPWSLRGLAKALRQLGRKKEAKKIEQEFNENWRDADISSTLPLI